MAPRFLVEILGSERKYRVIRLYAAILALVAMSAGTIYICFMTPLPVYFLDKTNLRPFFLPNIVCNNCTRFSFKYIINNHSACTDDILLLNIVISFHANVIARRNIRNTWGGVHEYKGYKIKTMFAFGVHEDKNFNNQLYIERNRTYDIIQGDFMDTYKSLTEKSLMLLHWATNYCKSAKFILKTDDDSFNHVHRIVDYLAGVQQHNFVGGYCFTVMPDRREGSKYYIPATVYPDVYYPTYCAGPGYILSQGAAKAILGISPNVTYLPMEDVYIAGLCRVVAGMKYTEIPGMIVGDTQMTPCDLATWAKNTHNIVPERMLELWDRATKAEKDNQCGDRNAKKWTWIILGLLVWLRIVYYMLTR